MFDLLETYLTCMGGDERPMRTGQIQHCFVIDIVSEQGIDMDDVYHQVEAPMAVTQLLVRLEHAAGQLNNAAD